MKRVLPIILFVLAGFSTLSSAVEKPVPFQTHDGYFVSNQFEAAAPTSFVVLSDQAAFDQVFGVAGVMRDKAHRLPPEAFAGRMVVAAIHRGKSVVSYQVERLAAEGRTLVVRYTTKVEPSSTAEFACPLIVSVPKGDYAAVQFVEDGKEIKRIAVAPREASTLKTTPEGEKRELLAEQETVAEFLGLHYQQCRGLTALCPDKCGSSGNFAKFRIIKYLSYKKPGQYGDPQVAEFVTQVDDNLGKLKLPDDQAKLLRALQKGDFVRLSWRHDYVTRDGVSSPERPLTEVAKISAAEARKLVGDTPLEAPAAKPGEAPIAR